MSWLQLWTDSGKWAAWGQRVENALARRWTPWFLLTAVAALYLREYLSHSALPRSGRPGWWSWQDQSFYRWTAEAVLQLSTDPGRYKVSLGYPLTALPFSGVMPEHLFLIPNLVMTLGIAVLFYRIGRSFLSRRDTILMMTIVVLWTREELVTSLVVPWSTIPTHLLGYWMIYLYLSRPASWRLALLLTLMTGLAYFCRPGDGAFLSPLVAAAVAQIPGSWKRRAAIGAVGVAVVLSFFAFDRLFNLAVFDRALSSYERGALDDFFGFSAAQRAYGLFIDGMPVHRVHDELILQRLTYLVFVGPGLWFMARRLRWRFAGPAACVAACLTLYLSYNYFRPFNLYRFHLIHYVTWLFPLGGLAAYLTFRRAWENTRPRTFALLLAIPVAAASFVRLEETPGPLAWVDDSGHLVAATDEWDAEASYDVFISRRATGRPPHPRAKGVKFEGFNEGDTNVGHLARRVPVGEIRYKDPRDFGATIELRRLEWSLRALPAPLEKRLRDDRISAPRAATPILEMTGGDKKLQTGVGKRDLKYGSLASTDASGILQRGPNLSLDPGRYVVEWFGRVEEGGKVVVEVTASEGGITLQRRFFELTPEQGPRLAHLSFRLSKHTSKVEFRFLIIEPMNVELRRVTLWHHHDWASHHQRD